jgi:hypothetical protein
MGDEMTEEESRALFAKQGIPENETLTIIAGARATYAAQHEKN